MIHKLLTFLCFVALPASSFGECLVEYKESPNTVYLNGESKAFPSWYPYSYWNETDQQYTGLDVSLIRKVLSQLNYRLEFVSDVPDNRRSADNEICFFSNAISGATFSEQRNAMYWFSDPYRHEISRVFVTDPKLLSMGSVEELLVSGFIGAVNQGAYFGKQFERLKQKYMGTGLMHIETSQRRLMMLSMKRIDFIIGDEIHLGRSAKAMALSEVIKSDIVVNSAPIHFGFARKSFDKHFVSSFNYALSRQLTAPIDLK